MNRLNSNPGIRPLSWAIVATVLTWSACGGGFKQPDTPKNMVEDNRRNQIRQLMGQIESMERGETVSIAEIKSVRTDSPTVEMNPTDPTVGNNSPRALASKPIIQREPPLPIPGTANMCFSRSDEREQKCTDMCQLASNICNNAGRICHLANELGDDDWARDRCSDASKSCTSADQRCCECS